MAHAIHHDGGSPGTGAGGVHASEADILNVLKTSGLLKQLEKIENAIEHLDKRIAKDVISAQDKVPTPLPVPKKEEPSPLLADYIDATDSTFVAEGRLDIVAPEDLPDALAASYKFASTVNTLCKPPGGRDVNMLIASALPKTEYRSAFRNSFYFEHATRTLYLRKEVLSSPGHMTLVLVHALAHIASDSFNNDQSAPYLRQLHALQKTLFTQLYENETRPAPAAAPTQPESRTPGKLTRMNISDLGQEIHSLRKNRKKMVREANELKDETKAQVNQLRELSEQVEDLEPGTEEYNEGKLKVHDLEQAVSASKAELRQMKAAIDATTRRIEDQSQELDVLNSSLQD
eukprot:TRINITY_DN18952_c0_g1_i1.p1 TRINITY_DN18952_c0_g1~~TRINITY_DN18952_c0_g1_i1.p1  ORF type:complete len:346 (+),score=94.46 TRINITY_DN18952_c0_g1_i1:376-1413(+)